MVPRPPPSTLFPYTTLFRSGPDLAKVREIALKLAQVVATDPRAKNINFNWIEPAREVRIQIDQDQARLLGLSSDRSEEHTSELQSLRHLVCRLLLEKKKIIM